MEGLQGTSPGPPRSHKGLLEPVPLRALWTLLNRPHHVDVTAVRVVCLLLLVTYLISSVVRHLPQREALAIRALFVAYVLIGVILAARFTWSTLRAYTVGMAILLPSTTAMLEVLRGNHPADLALTALSIFAPIIFLQTAADLFAVSAVLLAGILVLIGGLGPPGVPVAVAVIVLGGALIAGVTTALVVLAFRSRVSESTTWWQEACARERTLREFVELAAPQLGEQVLAHAFAARFRSTFGTGHCAILLLDGAGTSRVAATAGVAPAGAAATPAGPDAVAGPLAVVASREPLLCQPLTADDVRRRFAGLWWLAEGGTLVVLPVGNGEAMTGAIVLSATGVRPVAEEELLLWKAMANQVGVALGSARLFTRLQEALRARSEFISTMSHELRSPLHVILGYVDMLVDGKHEPTLVASRLRASASELLHVLESTLAAARLGTGKARVQTSEFPLGDLVTELRESVSALPEATAGVPVRWELDDQLPVVRADRLKLKEIVHNLVSNALKFTRQGEVVVRIGCEAQQIRVDVEDTGSGIPREAQARIFEMFERVEMAQEPRAAGVGLGLYIVKSLVQMMGGTIALASEPGRGSRFTVWLPLDTGR